MAPNYDLIYLSLSSTYKEKKGVCEYIVTSEEKKKKKNESNSMPTNS